MTSSTNQDTGYGISRRLAAHRSAAIRDLRYELALTLPREPDAPIDGRVAITFTVAGDDWPPLDFAPAADDAANARAVLGLSLNGVETAYALASGHICLADRAPRLPGGPQRLEIRFRAGTGGLTRRHDLVYSLFVPARAHRVFPCFDQPDLRASFRLELDLPGDWDGTSNAALVAAEDHAGRRRLRFAATEALPSYLLAFAAGRLRRETAAVGERNFTILLTAAAAGPFAEQRDEILRLHVAALAQLESYTAIPQPFAQTGFVLIPDFEFAGMEHPGAVFYRESLLLLPADAGSDARIRRAHLIAHETAHLWFGDLVTLRWFDDVWLKEVCANFLADRIVAREFPNVDHEAAFLLRHFPPAYAIDRTTGTHAIREPLGNLNQAAERYDALIYHKAPIAFAALEREIGERALCAALRSYLHDFRFGAADWDGLRRHLQQQTPADLDAFSRRWLERAGPPEDAIDFDRDEPLRYGLIRLGTAGRRRALDAFAGRDAAQTVTRDRAAAWIALVEDMLAGGLHPARLLSAGVEILRHERDAGLLTQLLDDLADIYWRALDKPQRSFAAGPVERVLRLRMDDGERGFWLSAYARFALTAESISWLESVWRGDEAAYSDLDEFLREELALTISMRRPERAAAILDRQIATTGDEHRRQRLKFLAPALAVDRATRDALFARLLLGEGRSLWSVAALRLLNHPLRHTEALHYLRPAIEHAAGIHARGDIFLPRQWLTALLFAHSSAEAAEIVEACLNRTSMSEGFRRVLLQVSDVLFRLVRNRGGG
jgi:aminopeptidase N